MGEEPGRHPHREQHGRRPVEAIQELTGGFGADVVIDAVGRPETWKQAFYARDLAGTVVLVGVPTPDMRIPDIPLIDVFGRGGSLKSSWYGDCLPSRDFPMLVDLYLQGRLDLDAFVSEEIALDDVEAAFEKMHHGDVLRSVVIFWMSRRTRVDHARRRSGTFSLDGETHDVDNNIWVVGTTSECVVIDAPHDVDAILDVVAGRQVRAILLHPRARRPRRVAPELRDGVGAPILLHPDDRPLWELTHTDELWDVDLDGRPDRSRSAGARSRSCTRPGTPPARSASTSTTSAASSPATPCSRAARGHRALVQRRGPDQGLDPGPAAHPPGRHRRAHRARRRHHDRRGGSQPLGRRPTGGSAGHAAPRVFTCAHAPHPARRRRCAVRSCAAGLRGVTPTSPDRLALLAVGIDPTPSPAPSVAPRPVLRPKPPAREQVPPEKPGRLPSAGETRRAAARVDAMSLPDSPAR